MQIILLSSEDIIMDIQIDKTTIDTITKQLAEGNTHNVRSGYLLGKIEGENVIVEGVYVPQQKSDRASSNISQEEQLNAFKIIENDGKIIVGHALYNGPYAAYENSSTELSRYKLSKQVGCPNIGLVVNSMNDYKLFK